MDDNQMNTAFASRVVGFVFVVCLFATAIASWLPREKEWTVALAISVVYVMFVFLVTRRVSHQVETETDSRENETGPAAAVSNQNLTEQTDRATPSRNSISSTPNSPQERPASKMPVHLSLLYGLLTLSVGLPGAILAVKAAPCRDPDHTARYGSSNYEQKPTWRTNTSLLPPAVQTWNQMLSSTTRDLDSYSVAFRGGQSFAQLYHNGTTTLTSTLYFTGTHNGSLTPRLQAMTTTTTTTTTSSESIDTHGPRQVGSFKDPLWLTSVSDQYICFRTRHNESDKQRYQDSSVLHCGNEEMGFASTRPFEVGEYPIRLMDFSDERLWFQTVYPLEGGPEVSAIANGYAIISLDPKNVTNMTYHSWLEEAKIPPDQCVITDARLNIYYFLLPAPALSSLGATICLFLVACPMAMLSVSLWRRQAVPSSSVTLFVSGGIVLGSLMSLGNPYGFMYGSTFWVAFVAPGWLLICSYILTISTRVSKEPLEWSVYSLSVAIFSFAVASLYWGDYSMIQLAQESGPVFSMTIVLLVVGFFPLCCIGILVGSRCIFVLGTLGVALDVANAVYLKLHRPVVAGLVICMTSILTYAISLHVYQKRNRLKTRMVEGLLTCNEYICGSADTADEENGAASREPLLVSPSRDDTET